MHTNTKLQLETEGPCYFVEYTDDRKDNIIFYNPRTKNFTRANISNVKLSKVDWYIYFMFLKY